MTILNSTYYDEIPDRDRYGDPNEDSVICLHVATSIVPNIIHLSLEQGSQYIELNLTPHHTTDIIIGLLEALIAAGKQ